uniref:CCR4-NOT transcription complex subunit 1 n=1 Tax=Lygus hesperus TaxID=30085 RepID=A0A0A9WXP9_LYGHE
MDKLVSDTSAMSHTMVDTSVDDVVGDLGPAFTSSAEACKGHIVQLVGRDSKPSDIAQVIILMLKSRSVEFWLETEGAKDKNQDPSHVPTPWNIENLVQAAKELNPKLNWSDVLLELDHSEFLVKDRHGLHLVIQTIRTGLVGKQFYGDLRFPVDHLYRPWKHTESQLSLITQILKNPDIFSFADYPFHSVSVDVLKAPPESENKEITCWRSMELIELVMHLAERGHYQEVHELIKVPIQHCPDVLMLGLLQISHTEGGAFRQEVLASLMPTFLGNHPNSAIILHTAWHTSHGYVKQIIMHSMADWYMRGDSDQSRLSRILDVAQDLKALSLLLNSPRLLL